MIAQRRKTRQRRSEVLERLAGATGDARGTRAYGRVSAPAGGETTRVERLSRALGALGPPFALFGLYLSSRGDILSHAYRRVLAAIGRNVAPLSPAEIRAIVR